MSLQIIQNKIFDVRGQRIMLDYDLTELYEVETKRINEQVRRNKDRFPEDFMFRITVKEWQTIRSQIATASENEGMRSQNVTASQNKRNTNVTPYAFTEHGVTMLASVLKSKRAVDMNIAIVRAFIAIRHFINKHKDLAEQLHEEFTTIDFIKFDNNTRSYCHDIYNPEVGYSYRISWDN